MAAVKAKNTKPELLVRRYLHSRNLRYRLHRKDLPGKPDIVFGGRKIVIFVHGCFWHAHANCKVFRLPKTRTGWWRAKLEGNAARDLRNIQSLQEAGWDVRVVWECEINDKTLSDLADSIK